MAMRGDVVIVDFPFTDLPAAKRRPAIVVQSDVYNQRISKTIMAMVTGNLHRRNDAAHLFVDPNSADGASSGLRAPSLVACCNLFTIDQADILKKLGRLSDVLQRQLNDCLKVALQVP